MEELHLFPKEYSAPVWIGKGAFGEVVRLRNLALGRDVAWKIFHKSADSSSLTEARLLAQKRSAVSPQVYRVGKWRGKTYVEMEWIAGLSLRDLLPFLPQKMEYRAEIALRIIKSLRQFHVEGGPHGDIQPSNILFPANHAPMLIDPAGRGWMSTGTPQYSAPELMDSAEAPTIQSDIYSVAVLCLDLGLQAVAGIPWDFLKGPAVVREEGLSRLVFILEEFLSLSKMVELDTILDSAYREYMAEHSAHSAELLLEKSPAHALELCQEALQWNPNQGLALKILPDIKIPMSRRKLWLKRSPWIFIALLLVLLIYSMYPTAEQQKKMPILPLPKQQPSLLLPKHDHGSPDTTYTRPRVFRASESLPDKALGWLVIPEGRRDCQYRIQDHPALLRGGRNELPQGAYRIHMQCPGQKGQVLPVNISPFAETVLPIGTLP